MSELVRSAASVTGVVLGLVVGVLWMWRAPRSTAPRRWLTLLLVVYLAVSVHAVARLSSWPLRRGFHTFTAADAPTTPYAVVVLGAGAKTIHGNGNRIGVLTQTGAARVLEAARVYRLLGGPLIVSSGGPPEGIDMIPESEIMRDALIDLGVPASKILLESASKVTRDEAVLTSELLRQRHIDACVLVTTDTHMRRALGAFRRAGLRVVPAIAPSPISRQAPSQSWLPTSQGVEFSQEVVHEHIGLLWYALRGWV